MESEPGQPSVVQAPVPGGPGFYSINPMEFLPEGWGAGRIYSGKALINQSQDDVWFVAPVHLPHGASVAKLVGYFYNSSQPEQHVYFALMSCWLGPEECVVVVEGSGGSNIPDTAPQIVDIIAVPNQVDLQSNSYYVRVKIPPSVDIGITGVRIDYGYSVNLPLITR